MSKSSRKNPGFDANAPKSAANLSLVSKSTSKRVRSQKGKSPDAFDLSTPVVNAEILSDPAPEPVAVTGEAVDSIVLTKRLTEKGGLTSYARPGVRASVYFSKGMFAGGVLPDSITLIGVGFSEPGAMKAPDAGKAEKAAARAQKAVEKAAKAAEKAAKAKAKAEAVAVTA